jgi:hypothetical protein
MGPRVTRLIGTLCVLVFMGCSGGDESSRPDAQSSRPAYTKEFSGGPVRMRVKTDSVEIGLADRIELTQELYAESGFQAELPEYLPEDFEDFDVVDIRQEAPATQENGEVLQCRTFVLEPNRSGTLTVAPMYVYFHKEGQKSESHFVTEAIEVQVEPIADASQLTLKPMRTIFRSEPSGSSGSGWKIGAASAAGLVVLIVILMLMWRRRRRPVAPAVPPHVLAFEALRRLVELKLIEQGQIERFFVGLSGILREYIERRFGVRAPERTTEEFLVEAERSPLLAGHRVRLREFLVLADQVKFATYQPPEADIQASFDVFKQFVQETATDAD